MKIPGRRDEIQSEAVKLLDPRTKSQIQGQNTSTASSGAASSAGTDSVNIDVQFGRAIGAGLDPAIMEAEQRAKVEDIKRRVQSGTYVMPSSDEIAQKFSDEVNFEIMATPKDRSSDSAT